MKYTEIMKRYIIFLLLFGLVSCEGFLGKEPISSLTPGLFWKTQDDVEAAKATMYSAMATAMDANFFNGVKFVATAGEAMNQTAYLRTSYVRMTYQILILQQNGPTCMP